MADVGFVCSRRRGFSIPLAAILAGLGSFRILRYAGEPTTIQARPAYFAHFDFGFVSHVSRALVPIPGPGIIRTFCPYYHWVRSALSLRARFIPGDRTIGIFCPHCHWVRFAFSLRQSRIFLSGCSLVATDRGWDDWVDRGEIVDCVARGVRPTPLVGSRLVGRLRPDGLMSHSIRLRLPSPRSPQAPHLDNQQKAGPRCAKIR